MSNSWLLLLYALPTRHGSRRVGLWRTLKKIGAVSLKTSASLLPDTPAHYERFQWLAKQIRDDGGDAVVVR
ncbi:MAG: chromate resistance protein ChrB, partial [Verrucomicrobiota bacterium]|nr:chromate resistance protein ChrB [Verrucomicrobiota bacterium]